MKNNKKELIKITKLKEEKDRQLLNLEIFLGSLVTLVFCFCIFITTCINLKEEFQLIIILIALIPFLIGLTFCLRIEQIAGYYNCKICNHKYIPKFKSVLWAMHIGRIRYMKCPKCGKYSWNKKVISKED